MEVAPDVINNFLNIEIALSPVKRPKELNGKFTDDKSSFTGNSKESDLKYFVALAIMISKHVTLNDGFNI